MNWWKSNKKNCVLIPDLSPASLSDIKVNGMVRIEFRNNNMEYLLLKLIMSSESLSVEKKCPTKLILRALTSYHSEIKTARQNFHSFPGKEYFQKDSPDIAEWFGYSPF